MKLLFTLILIMYSLVLFGQEQVKEIYGFINDIKNNHIKQDLDSFYLNQKPIECTINYSWVNTYKDSISKYLNKKEVDFINRQFDTATFKHNILLKPTVSINKFDNLLIDKSLPANESIYKILNKNKIYHVKIKWFGLGKKHQIKKQIEKQNFSIPNRFRQIYNFSVPLIIDDIAFITIYKYTSPMGSSGSTYLYKKIDNNWKLVCVLYSWNS